MNRATLWGLAALASLTACGTTTAAAPPADSNGLIIGYGSLGAAHAGMTPSDALATGLFTVPVPGPEGCPQRSLEFKPAFKGVGVTSFEGKPIEAMTIYGEGMTGIGPQTARGVHLGTEESALKATYGSGLTSGPPSFYGRTYEIHQGRAYINFLIGPNDGPIHGTKVTHIAVTTGTPYDFNQDGC